MSNRRLRPKVIVPRQIWRVTYMRQWREFCGLSLETAARQINLTHGQLSRIERGHFPYGQAVLEACATLYQCTVADLLTRAPDDPTLRPARTGRSRSGFGGEPTL